MCPSPILNPADKILNSLIEIHGLLTTDPNPNNIDLFGEFKKCSECIEEIEPRTLTPIIWTRLLEQTDRIIRAIQVKTNNVYDLLHWHELGCNILDKLENHAHNLEEYRLIIQKSQGLLTACSSIRDIDKDHLILKHSSRIGKNLEKIPEANRTRGEWFLLTISCINLAWCGKSNYDKRLHYNFKSLTNLKEIETRLQPLSLEESQRYFNYLFGIQQNLAFAYYSKNELDKALEFFRAAFETAVNPNVVNYNLWEICQKIAEIYFQQNKFLLGLEAYLVAMKEGLYSETQATTIALIYNRCRSNNLSELENHLLRFILDAAIGTGTTTKFREIAEKLISGCRDSQSIQIIDLLIDFMKHLKALCSPGNQYNFQNSELFAASKIFDEILNNLEVAKLNFTAPASSLSPRP